MMHWLEWFIYNHESQQTHSIIHFCEDNSQCQARLHRACLLLRRPSFIHEQVALPYVSAVHSLKILLKTTNAMRLQAVDTLSNSVKGALQQKLTCAFLL